MGCDESKAKMDPSCFSAKNITMYFRYKFKETTTQEQKDAIYKEWLELNAYFKKIGAFGPILLNLAFVRTADGWEGHETFVDAAAYEKHSDNTMAYPNIGRVFEAVALYDEVESWICGREDEIAKAPKIAEYYPTQKRIFVQDNN